MPNAHYSQRNSHQWQVILWQDEEQLDLWDCISEMIIATDVHQHYMDEWNDIFNLPATFASRVQEENSVERASRI